MMELMIQMPRFNRLRPVKSIKHIIDLQGGLVAAAQQTLSLVSVVDNPVTTSNPNQVATSSTVGSLFLNVQVAATGTAALANVYMYVMKNPGNNVVPPIANAVGNSDNRRHIMHQEMIMTEKNTTAIPRTLFKGVIRIPRGMKRSGIDDEILIALFSPGVNFDFCIQCIYKEYQ